MDLGDFLFETLRLDFGLSTGGNFVACAVLVLGVTAAAGPALQRLPRPLRMLGAMALLVLGFVVCFNAVRGEPFPSGDEETWATVGTKLVVGAQVFLLLKGPSLFRREKLPGRIT